MTDRDRQQKIQRALDPETLLREAEKIAGLRDFGNSYFMKPFTEQLNRAAREVEFTEQGLQQQKADYRRYLVNRLRMQHDIKRHPEILDEDVSDPIIVIGLPRSGTTKLNRMMAAEPNAQKLFAWRLMNPARFPDAKESQPDPRITAGGDDFLSGKRHSELGAGHEMGANLVDSDIALFEQTFDLGVLGMTPRIPVLQCDHWVRGMPETDGDREAYRYLRLLLQYLQWQDGGKRNRPWFIKSIIHHPHIETALAYFPKATFVHCQRDPVDSVASFAKIQLAAFKTRSSNIDNVTMGRRVLKYCAIGMARYMEMRDRLKLDERIVDAKYDNIRNDVMPIIRAAYERAGLHLSAEAEQCMLQWERDNEQHKLGKHTYSLEEFGLGKAMIDKAFAEFIDRFVER